MLMKWIHFIGYDGAEKYVSLFAITNDDLLALYKQEGCHGMCRFRKKSSHLAYSSDLNMDDCST